MLDSTSWARIPNSVITCYYLVCGCRAMGWMPLCGMGEAIVLLKTYSHVYTWPSIVFSLQVFISLCLFLVRNLTFLGKV